jgi:peptidoglycan/LPS O-acetylase OafA/YrhL
LFERKTRIGRILGIPLLTLGGKQNLVTNSHPAFDPRRAAHRRPGLDLLRALAIVFVVVYHAGLFGFALPFRVQRFGWIGVDLFFVLSGYLIGGQLLSRLARGNRQMSGADISLFYWRRALRILPAYVAIVAVYFFLPAALREYERMPPVWKFLTFTQNIGLRGGTAFSHAWSLCIEGQFYLLLPFVILALVRSGRMSVSILAPVAILAWCIVIRGVLAHVNLGTPQASFGWWQQWIYYPTYSRLDALTIGVSLAAIECFRPHWWSNLTKTARWLWLPGITAIVVALILAEDGLDMVSSSLGFFLVALGCGAFLVCAVSPQLPLSRVAIPGAAFLATVAYSIYLSHKLAIHWIEDVCAAHSINSGSVVAYLLVIVAILFLGSALFFVVERPFLRIRERKQTLNA